ncbi:GPW/gp25 family protein [Echinicola rosea]|uniref:Baseplate protein n=1 Tax=Echinicola rosea TaxID=1807691 RepID=A0ABQ1V7G9_9BACT|nr:GPW/gp25 family protein [Echinicola rosea]GGF39501.1 baseplate protein [Echinicola rosea]
MADSNEFLGTGWSFPPEFNKESGRLKTSTGVEDINQSLEILFGTKLGERIMQPTYGCNLDELLFSSMNRTLKTYVTELIKNAILYHEPRIETEKIDITQGDELKGELLIHLHYRVRATNARKNMVYPFYMEEGTDISR